MGLRASRIFEISKINTFFIGAVKQKNRLTPNLNQLCFPVKPLRKTEINSDWKQEHDKTLKKFNENKQK